MISTSRQQWTPGQQVRVGFLTLTVRAAVATPGDFAPDAYILTNGAGTQAYKFVPHRGLEKIGPSEAAALIADQDARTRREALQVMAKAKADAEASRTLDAIFARA